jgi:hypothetical protein
MARYARPKDTKINSGPLDMTLLEKPAIGISNIVQIAAMAMRRRIYWGPYRMAIACVCEKPNAQVNRQKCEAFLSALNRQLALATDACA